MPGQTNQRQHFCGLLLFHFYFHMLDKSCLYVHVSMCHLIDNSPTFYNNTCHGVSYLLFAINMAWVKDVTTRHSNFLIVCIIVKCKILQNSANSECKAWKYWDSLFKIRLIFAVVWLAYASSPCLRLPWNQQQTKKKWTRRIAWN